MFNTFAGKTGTQSGNVFEYAVNAQISGAWLTHAATQAVFTAQESNIGGGPTQIYAGYRIPGLDCEKVAISIDANGEVFVQVLIQGAVGEPDRIKSIPLSKLEELLRGDDYEVNA